MVHTGQTEQPNDTPLPHLLIIDAPYYTHISKALREGAEEVLTREGATWDVCDVPGVLEIPAAIAIVLDGMDGGGKAYDGFVLLGCVIRGETTHYDIVAFESARAIMNMSIAEASVHRQRHSDDRKRRTGAGPGRQGAVEQGWPCRSGRVGHDQTAREIRWLTNQSEKAGLPGKPNPPTSVEPHDSLPFRRFTRWISAARGWPKPSAEYENFRLGQEVDGETYRAADAGWFRNIVAGVVAEQTTIDPVIHRSLAVSWKLERIDSILRATLRAAVWELRSKKDVSARVIVSEYVEVTKAFFDDEEPRVVNGVLNTIARDMRPQEFEKTA